MAFRLTVFPAEDGDCLLLSLGDTDASKHILIDGGRRRTYEHLKPALEQVARRGEELELLVLSHIDADHIEGSLRYLQDQHRPIVPKRVWYNGYQEMSHARVRSERQGDEFSAAIKSLGWPLNEEFSDGVACVESARSPIDVAGAKLTLLSPDREHLSAMSLRWEDWRNRDARSRGPLTVGATITARRPMPETLDVEQLASPGSIDREKPNGSSIAFIIEYDGIRLLLTGDAHPDLLARSLAPFAEADGGRYKIDAFKISHHGSAGNTTPELVRLLNCPRFVISSDGSRHGHPDPEAIARLLKHSAPGPKELIFNYQTGCTLPWFNASLMSEYDYTCRFGETGYIEVQL